ncbi:uncharacterized protein LOC124169133 [Ischnura elegans]|uniref:uncharacterized protein LOC124169133 n=1 Tax=Ischnura elegans TaxID=197161 RepID=UPI001ED86651|nr:uncharacterized protein LOC124169133 [Ischnura elegans]
MTDTRSASSWRRILQRMPSPRLFLFFLSLLPLPFASSIPQLTPSPPTPKAIIAAATPPWDLDGDADWRCPDPAPSSSQGAVSCACDLPHTLRCSGGDRTALGTIADALRRAKASSVSLLDCSLSSNVTWLPPRILQGVSLHGLVVSSGAVRRVSDAAFDGLASPLLALGLPNNALSAVPTPSLALLSQLERLDLSRNHIKALDAKAFRGLGNLTFLDLSDNPISRVAPGTFSGSLPALRTLRLRGTRLDAATVASAFRGARVLRELDLSSSSVKGPLGPESLPPLPTLLTLSLARNNLTSVRRGALEGLKALSTLTLSHNQIDVLEDHAFLHLGALIRLDLSHNRVVTVSGASLAHLGALKHLDLAHNFLRALTADVVAPLRSLEELRLDDNDISMVASGAMGAAARTLRRLTLSDNPLNCDCNMAEFASWLSAAAGIPTSDRATALCATPPSLENGLLVEVPSAQLLCGGDGEAPPSMQQQSMPSSMGGELEDSSRVMGEDPLGLHPPPFPPTSSLGSRLRLLRFAFDGFRVSLLWAVEAGASAPYACDALFVYEEVGAHEILLQSSPLHCNSSALPDASRLAVALPSVDLQIGHKYRYCVVLLESDGPSRGEAADEVSLAIGCSEVIQLVLTGDAAASPPPTMTPGELLVIDAFDANSSAGGSVDVFARISSPRWADNNLEAQQEECQLTVVVFVDGASVAKRRLECPSGHASFAGLPAGPYRVCAGLGADVTPSGRCVTLRDMSDVESVEAARRKAREEEAVIALAVGAVVLAGALAALLYALVRRVSVHHGKGGQGTREDPRYVKLQATTKV